MSGKMLGAEKTEKMKGESLIKGMMRKANGKHTIEKDERERPSNLWVGVSREIGGGEVQPGRQREDKCHQGSTSRLEVFVRRV